MNIERIKREAPPMATHYCEKNEVYISSGKWFLNGNWIQYDDSYRMELIPL